MSSFTGANLCFLRLLFQGLVMYMIYFWLIETFSVDQSIRDWNGSYTNHHSEDGRWLQDGINQTVCSGHVRRSFRLFNSTLISCDTDTITKNSKSRFVCPLLLMWFYWTSREMLTPGLDISRTPDVPGLGFDWLNHVILADLFVSRFYDWFWSHLPGSCPTFNVLCSFFF